MVLSHEVAEKKDKVRKSVTEKCLQNQKVINNSNRILIIGFKHAAVRHYMICKSTIEAQCVKFLLSAMTECVKFVAAISLWSGRLGKEQTHHAVRVTSTDRCRG